MAQNLFYTQNKFIPRMKLCRECLKEFEAYNTWQRYCNDCLEKKRIEREKKLRKYHGNN